MVDTRQAVPLEAIKYLIYHTFLPPKLPDGDDANPQHESILLSIVVDSLKHFRECVTHDLRDALDSATVMIANLSTVHGSFGFHGSVREGPFRTALQNLHRTGGTILLHIGEQNAGIMIGKVQDSIHVEAFELSPQSEAVIGTLGRLRRCFPGPVVSLAMDTFQDPGFQDTISHTLAKMSSQRSVDTLPQIKKSGSMHDEIRDTAHPKMVTELFIGFLSAVGKPVDAPRIWKNTRDEVMWADSLLPWRRSPLWVLVRVALQLSLTRGEAASGTASDPRMSVYKLFMLFHMARVLDLPSTRRAIRIEMLHIMNAKLARRLLKLNPSFDAPGISFVRSVMSNTHLILKTTWSITMDRTTPRFDLRPIENLDFGKDVRAHLPAVESFISSLCQRKRTTASFNFNPTSSLAKYKPDDLPSSAEFSTGAFNKFNLMGFEDWVAANLTSWIQVHKRDADSCEKLGRLIGDYHGAAQSLYSCNPEATSVMLLTILELWVACDKSATHICPLLLDYYPGIPKGLLQSLILPFRDQMERLRRIEDYLISRSFRARFRGQEILKDFGTADSFPVRYFDQSQEHINLLDDIKISAARQRQDKCKELHQKKAEYDKFMQLYDQAECEYYEESAVDTTPEERHSSSCRKCGYRSQARNMGIRIHEWPLPKSETEQKAAVFELKVPRPFGHWRDTTVHLLLDILEGDYLQRVTPRSSYPLRKDAGLSPFFTTFGSEQRIGLLSQVKPHIVTHRRNVGISTASEDTVCLPNGLRYQYYDSNTENFVSHVGFKDKTPEACRYRLPPSSESLQRFLFRPSRNPEGPFHNDVIASQSKCPKHLSLDEYKALCNLPLGHLLQWKNILLQLFAPSVDFAKPETGLVILQAIHQAGPCSDGNVLRDGHTIVDHEQFALAFLRGLSEGLQRMKENWESSQSLSTFISLAARLLSLTAADKIKGICLDYLSHVRVIAFNWVNLIREKAHIATEADIRRDLHCKSVEIALICVDSFNVDPVHLKKILASPTNASVLIRCGVIIREGRNSVSDTSNPVVDLLLHRQRLLSYRSYSILSTEILDQGSSALDDAISQSWSAYQAGGIWGPVRGHEYWLARVMVSSGDRKTLNVHFNLLTCELLVNGLPLGRLPAEYQQHAAYRTLFGNITLEVMPTSTPGMQFSSKESYAGHTLHFGLGPSPTSGSGECDLLVQAIRGNRIYELVPRHVLRGEFPSAFIDKFVHWYSMTDQCLEFRPEQAPWASSSDNWRLTRAGDKWRLVKDGVSLVYVRSTTAKVLSLVLDCLEDPLHVHIMFHHSSSSIEIELPRIQLGFYMKQGASSIQSRQFRGMFIAPEQSLGTLIGLRSRLVLESRQGSRLVLVPEGCVSVNEGGDHVLVTVGKDSTSRAHAYHVDGQLGRLVDNGSLPSKLFLCYLHALTASCLPDPLTGRTGTEQALSILNSAAVRSFGQLSPEELNLLDKIAHLSPSRRCYPRNKRVMQSVTWSPGLSSLSQHGGFYESVRSILDEAQKAKIFHPDSVVQLPSLDFTDSLLLERDNIRSSTFRISGFGAEAHTVARDKPYSARDDGQGSTKCVRALTLSRMVYEGRPNLVYPVGDEFGDDLWRFLCQSSEVFGISRSLPSLQYDPKLLMSASDFISAYWIPLHIYLRKAAPATDKFKFMIWLSTVAFAKNANQNIIQTVVAFFTVSAEMKISPPSADVFLLQQGTSANKRSLREIIEISTRGFGSSREAKLPRGIEESKSSYNSRRRRLYAESRDRAVAGFVDKLVAQWPCEVPATPAGRDYTAFQTYIDVGKAMEMVKAKFKIWYDNLLFRKYLDHIAEQLTNLPSGSPAPRPVSFTKPEWNLERRPAFVRIDDVFECAAPPLPACEKSIALLPSSVPSSAGASQPRLALLLARLEQQATTGYEKSYVEDLRKSLLSLHGMGKESDLPSSSLNASDVLEHLHLCKAHVTEMYSTIAAAAIPTGIDSTHASRPRYLAAASKIQQYPRLSPVFFLQQLARHRWNKISRDWQNCVVHYALALTELQRAERLAIAVGNDAELLKELRNVGHTNWDPFEHPETLLLEVESGIMIREPQEQIAQQMRAPVSNQNVVMQLNMGEGKSSVIVPIVAAALADGTRLVRVIVAKPQSKQMFQMLLSKLGGLLDRRIYQVPFSRNLRFRAEDASAVGNICRECMKNGGIMLVQPEHILSFKLMGLESLISGKAQIGRALLSTQEFFDESSRDIVDESDENFSVKFELIYTMGMQRPVELSPDRWILIHQVLSLVRMYAPDVLKELPFSIEVGQNQKGSFPRTRLLRQDAQELILGRVARHICDNGLEGFPIARRPWRVREAVLRYMTQSDLSQVEIDQVEKLGSGGFWSDTTKTPLLLLRGLMAGGILAFAFGQKRWRVNYGLDIHRRPATRLAVPYRAKDSPAPRSEFSHPDVVIVLTCLTYYYCGLEDEDLFLAFDHIMRSDQSGVEYQTWIKDAPDLPPTFHQLSGINLKDNFQCVNQVFPHLRFAKGAIDYFLSHTVFPKEMKEFPHKLSASGWDIGQAKAHPTTGFSGTNDSRQVLPLGMKQLCLAEQIHTNALVLEYLLQPENSVTLMAARDESAGSDAEVLLTMVTKLYPPTRVILDVGAQILELRNIEVAEQWLKIMPDEGAQAVVFFNDADELSVIDRKGRVEPFQTSPYSGQLDLCLVFLDEAHTRGTDLRLPDDYRAAATLGANLTKDRLVQACMRMRKLGKGQSIVFCVPQEVNTKILALGPNSRGSDINVSDILNWAISETFVDTRRSMPLWAVQGQRFQHQRSLWVESRIEEPGMSQEQAGKFLEDEARTLDQRYRPSSVAEAAPSEPCKDQDPIAQRCSEFGNLHHADANLQEEQERELAPEIEQERQVQRPPACDAAEHHLHDDVVTFATTGALTSGSIAYRPAFETLRDTSAATHVDVSQFGSELLATADFAFTVKISGSLYVSDEFQRPVQWILTSRGSDDTIKHMMIISPYEAQRLMPIMWKSKATALHLYAPRSSLASRALDSLDLYTVTANTNPPVAAPSLRLAVQLNLFAGQLYLSSFDEYVQLCEYLGLAWEPTENTETDGFILHDNESNSGGGGQGRTGCGFTASPVKLLKVFMTKVRRNCEGIDKTHMGAILDGRVLRPTDFDKLREEGLGLRCGIE